MKHTVENGKHILTYSARCYACEGTGLYVGMCERDGSAVVCAGCKGSGESHHAVKWEDFNERSTREAVTTVISVNPGICVGTGNGHSLSDFGGMDYRDWLNGDTFPDKSEMRQFTCPAWWYQTADYKKKPEWDQCSGCGAFPKCKHFPDKSACWQRFDNEQTDPA